jgi:serine/threonine-protein kinase
VVDVVNDGGELLLVQEYVHGISLSVLQRAAAARGERLPPSVAAAIAVGMLDGLHAAHTARDEAGGALDLVHRDVSPQNVIVTADGNARVLDFGMAWARGRVTETVTGVVKGKLGYMAPEQLRGKELSAATDVWAVGVVLWEMLTGKRLFAGSEEEVVERIVLGDVTPPSRLAPEVAALDEVVAHALTVAVADRFASADAMARAIETALRPAYASEVEGCVVALAGEQLRARADLVAKVEAAARKLGRDEVAAAAPAPARAASSARMASTTRIAAGVGIAVLLIVGALAALGSGARDRPSELVVDRTIVPPPSAPSVAVAPSEMPSSEAPPDDDELPAAGEVRPKVHVPPTRSRPVKNPCAIPFTFDDAGRKAYKRECL